jgi:hypothetical protein
MKYKEITNKLLDIFQTKNRLSLSNVTHTFLQEIYEYIYDAYLELPNFKIQQVPSSREPSENYIPKPVYDDIQENYQNRKSYSFEIQQRTFCVYFYEKKAEPKVTQFYKECLKKMYLWLFVADKYASSHCSENMNIYIYFTDNLKMLPTDRGAICEINVNTAFTTACQKTTVVQIFRQEEWFKVFIHETFHNLGLDFSGFQENITRNKMLELIPINTDFRLYEAYCEVWAETIHTMFLTFFSTQNKTNGDAMFSKLENMLEIEIEFSLFQATKILKYYNMKYEDLYSNSSSSHRLRTQYYEKSSVLTYYVIKCVLFFHLNEFIEWCVKQNSCSLEFRKNNTNIKSYCKLIESLYREPEFIKKMVETREKMDEEFSPTKEEYKTLRMTLFEI